MGVCVTVRDVVNAIVRTKSPTDPQHILLAELLRLMPRYGDAQLLDAWEAAVAGVLPEHADASEVGKLFLATFEFGRENLYCAFDRVGIRVAFEQLATLLRTASVLLAEPLSLDGW